MSMKLYNNDLSPYTTRIRMQIRFKGLENEIEIVAKPDGDAYKSLNFTGKVPSLDTGQGYILPESETIAEYLEDSYPEPPMRGHTVLGKAKVRLVSRLLDSYMVPGLNILFGQLNPKTRDAERASEGLGHMETTLGHLERVVEGPRYALENRLTLADCALVPMLFFCNFLQPAMGGEALKSAPKLKAYFAAITKDDEIAAKAVAEMGAALSAVRGGR